MTMTLSGKRILEMDEGGDGSLSFETMFNRFNNLLNITYLNSQKLDDGGYRIPEKVFELIQTELDFNPPEEDGKTNKKKLEAQKQRYRQRATYRFWRDILNESNYKNDVEAERVLLSIYHKLDNCRAYGSMTHCKYALETLHLAIDDVYGSSRCRLEVPNFTKSRFGNSNPKKAKATRKKLKGTKAKKGVKARASTKTALASQMSHADMPF